MPKIIDYPRVPFPLALDLAEATYALGGSCKPVTAADKLGKKMTGAFTAIIGSAGKFRLLTSKGGLLQTTDLFKSVKLAYSEEEKKEHLIEAFLSPPLYSAIAAKFNGLQLPMQILDKVLAKEMGVDPDAAPMVAQHFVKSAKWLGILENDRLVLPTSTGNGQAAIVEPTISDEPVNEASRRIAEREVLPLPEASIDADVFSIQITGPGMNSRIVVKEEDDLLIVQAMLNKVKKRLTG